MIRHHAHNYKKIIYHQKTNLLMVSFVAPINVFAFLHVVSWLDIGALFLFPPFLFGVGVCSLIKFCKVSTLKRACGYMNLLKVSSYVLRLIVIVVRLATS
jgi:hypothetical protein